MPKASVSSGTVTSVAEDDLSVRLEVIERQLSRMEPDDPEMPELIKEAKTLRREGRIRHLSKELQDLLNGTDSQGMFF